MLRRLVIPLLACLALGARSTPESEEAPVGHDEGKKNRPRWPQPALAAPAGSGPEILFTFDDGPHEDVTPLILDALARHQVRAIFFVTGWRITGTTPNADRRREVARRALAEGHALGNHTIDHSHLCSRISDEQAAWEIDENQRILNDFSNMVTSYFRVPYGSRCRRVEELLAARGWQHLHWDLDPHEYLHHSQTVARDYLIRKLSKLEDRAVILMHDTQLSAARALPEVLDWLQAENHARQERGDRPIRVLSYADLVMESLPPPMRALLEERPDLGRAVPDLTRRLLGPLAGAQDSHTASTL